MTDDAPVRRCSWCEAVAIAEATHCQSCGAALAQREDLGGIIVPGVTDVDPGLADLADRPLRITGASPSQGLAPALIVGVALGGPLGVAAVGGVAAVAGAEYLGARRPGLTAPDGLDSVGRTSEVARRVAERLDRGEAAPPDWSGSDTASGGVADDTGTGDPGTDDRGADDSGTSDPVAGDTGTDTGGGSRPAGG
jgi:hypothetical protein